MTVIVYRDGVVAADSMEAGGDLRRGSVQKIIQWEGRIAGAAGEGGDCEAFLEWVRYPVKGPPEIEPSGEGAQFEGFVIRQKDNIWVVDRRCIPWQIFAPFLAIGNGAAIAIGAMEMGATAEEAVAAAIKWSPACGGDIHTIRLPT
jgi:hypothetical protein